MQRKYSAEGAIKLTHLWVA